MTLPFFSSPELSFFPTRQTNLSSLDSFHSLGVTNWVDFQQVVSAQLSLADGRVSDPPLRIGDVQYAHPGEGVGIVLRFFGHEAETAAMTYVLLLFGESAMLSYHFPAQTARKAERLSLFTFGGSCGRMNIIVSCGE